MPVHHAVAAKSIRRQQSSFSAETSSGVELEQRELLYSKTTNAGSKTENPETFFKREKVKIKKEESWRCALL